MRGTSSRRPFMHRWASRIDLKDRLDDSTAQVKMVSHSRYGLTHRVRGKGQTARVNPLVAILPLFAFVAGLRFAIK